MTDDQFNELLAYTMIVALNTTALLFQQSRQTRLSPEEIDFCQMDTLKTAQLLKEKIAGGSPFEWPPASGRADSPRGGS